MVLPTTPLPEAELTALVAKPHSDLARKNHLPCSPSPALRQARTSRNSAPARGQSLMNHHWGLDQRSPLPRCSNPAPHQGLKFRQPVPVPGQTLPWERLENQEASAWLSDSAPAGISGVCRLAGVLGQDGMEVEVEVTVEASIPARMEHETRIVARPGPEGTPPPALAPARSEPQGRLRRQTAPKPPHLQKRIDSS